MKERCSYCINVDAGDRGMHECSDSMTDFEWSRRVQQRETLKPKTKKVKVTMIVEVPGDTYDIAYTQVLKLTEERLFAARILDIISMEGV